MASRGFAALTSNQQPPPPPLVRCAAAPAAPHTCLPSPASPEAVALQAYPAGCAVRPGWASRGFAALPTTPPVPPAPCSGGSEGTGVGKALPAVQLLCRQPRGTYVAPTWHPATPQVRHGCWATPAPTTLGQARSAQGLQPSAPMQNKSVGPSPLQS